MEQPEITKLFNAIDRGEQECFEQLVQGILQSKNEKQQNKLFNTKNQAGESLLFAAVKKQLLSVVKVLVALDVDVNEQNPEGDTPLAHAVRQSQQSETSNDLRIAAVLKTAAHWQQYNKTFSFNRVLHMLQKIFPRISAAHGHDKVLIIGRTGSGKSTLLNHLNGTVYRLMVNAESGKLSAVPSSGEPEIAETASSMHSKTIYPQVVKHKIKDYVYCDLAGLGDTHGDSYRICAASSVQILRGLAGGIKGVAIVLDLSSFLPRGELFRQTAVAFSKMVQHSHNLLDSVCFVVTHIAPHMLSTITPDGIIKDYVDNILDNYDDDEEGETEEEKALLFMLRAMKERKKQILISDITSGKFKEQLELFIGSLPVKHANEFTFLDHDHAQKDFNNVILRLMEYYLQLNTEFEQIPEMIAEKEERVLALKMSIGLIEHDKKRYEDLLDQTIKQQQQTDAILIQHPQNPYWQGQKADNAEMIKNQRARILELTALLANTDKDKSDCVESIVQLKHQQKQLQYELEESANLFTTVYVVSHLLDLQKEAVADFYAAYEAKHPKALDELGVFVKDSMRENKKTLSARQTWNLKNKQVLFNYEQKLEKGDDGPFSDLQYTDCEP